MRFFRAIRDLTPAYGHPSQIIGRTLRSLAFTQFHTLNCAKYPVNREGVYCKQVNAPLGRVRDCRPLPYIEEVYPPSAGGIRGARKVLSFMKRLYPGQYHSYILRNLVNLVNLRFRCHCCFFTWLTGFRGILS